MGISTQLREAKWSTEDLARRLGHALDIAQQAVDRLAAKGYSDSQEPSNNLRPEKLISETAFLLVGASAARGYPEVGQRIRSVAERLLPHARSERMLLGVCLEPALALDLLKSGKRVYTLSDRPGPLLAAGAQLVVPDYFAPGPGWRTNAICQSHLGRQWLGK